MRILVRPFAYRHPRAWGGLALIAGSWLLFLGSALCAGGFWWGTLLIAVGALELWIACRLVRSVRSQPAASGIWSALRSSR